MVDDSKEASAAHRTARLYDCRDKITNDLAVLQTPTVKDSPTEGLELAISLS